MNRSPARLAAVFGALVVFGITPAAPAGNLMLWYEQPAGLAPAAPPITGSRQPPVGLGGGKASPFMNEALPIGNGCLGGLISGGVGRERVAPPWTFDITELVRPGENRIEALICSTLANHYTIIPTQYRGSTVAGLLGPVQIKIQRP